MCCTPALDEARVELNRIATTLQLAIYDWERKTGLQLACIELGRLDTSTHAQESSVVSVLCTAKIEVKRQA